MRTNYLGIITLTLVLPACAAHVQTPVAAFPPVNTIPCSDSHCSGPKNAQKLSCRLRPGRTSRQRRCISTLDRGSGAAR